MAEKTKWTRDQIIAAASLAAVVLGIVVVWYQTDSNQRENWKRDSQKEYDQQIRDANAQREAELRNRPNLKYVSGSVNPGRDGFTRIKFQNASPSKNAVISSIELQVSDPATLERIAKYHPRIPPTTGAIVDKQEVRLIHGSWNHGFTTYTFYVYPDFYVEPDKPIEIATCIVDPKLPLMDIAGVLFITVSSGDSDTPMSVTLRSRQR